MKRAIRKFGLSLVPAMALAALFTACGEDGKNGVDGVPGEQGAVGESCTAKPLADDSGYTLTCGNEEVGVIRNGEDGVKGKDGVGCIAKSMENGDYEISCGGVVVGVLLNGNDGSNGQDGADGKSCSAKALADGSGYTLTCGGVDVGTISNGLDGYSCRASQNAEKTVTTITCETADGEVSYEVANGRSTYEIAVEAGFQGSEAEWLESLKGDKGDDGVGCEVSRNGYELTITCANSKEVVDLRDLVVTSSSSSSVTSSSSGVSSSSIDASSSSSSTSSSSSWSEAIGSKTALDYLNQEMLAAGKYGGFTDARDGQVYKTVTIGTQTWMAQNLNYRGEQSWCGGGNGTTEGDCSVYGRLYTWAAAVDACPDGWHLPSNAEWSVLYGAVDGSDHVAQKLKANANLWNSNNGSDEYGFAILPAGSRNFDGEFNLRSYNAYFWSSTEDVDLDSYAWDQVFYYDLDNVDQGGDNKNYAFSVRCLKDSDEGSEISSSSNDASSSSSEMLSEQSSSSMTLVGSSNSVDSPVKPSGYYSNSSNCPAGLDCKYATTTDYLKSSKTYGEILDTRDGQVYKTVTIGTQIWMAQNLNYAPDPEKVSSMGDYAWSGCYGDENANCSKYGRLYTWEVAMDNADCAYDKKCNASLKPATPVRGVCPSGWHLPSHYEFEQLINFIDPTFGYNHTDDASSSKAGLYLKSQSGWISSGKGSDAYGFSALPGGYRSSNGDFFNEGDRAYFWSSGEYNSNFAFNLDLYYNIDYANLYWYYKNSARSVRCLKD